MTRRGALFPPTITTAIPCTIVVDMTPHPCLSPNSRAHERTKARHRKELKAASYLAAHNVFIAWPDCARLFRTGRIRFSFRVAWEARRQRMDDDNLIAALKNGRDGICQKLDRTDAEVETGTVEQEFSDARQGHIIVTIDRVEG